MWLVHNELSFQGNCNCHSSLRHVTTSPVQCHTKPKLPRTIILPKDFILLQLPVRILHFVVFLMDKFGLCFLNLIRIDRFKFKESKNKTISVAL